MMRIFTNRHRHRRVGRKARTIHSPQSKKEGEGHKPALHVVLFFFKFPLQSHMLLLGVDSPYRHHHLVCAQLDAYSFREFSFASTMMLFSIIGISHDLHVLDFLHPSPAHVQVHIGVFVSLCVCPLTYPFQKISSLIYR